MFKFKKNYVLAAAVFVCLFGLFKTSPAKCGVAITDTDGGVNYFQKGQTYTGAYFRDTTDAYTDACTTGNYLMEYYVADNEIKYDSYECPNGCKDDACVLEPKRGQKIGDVDGDGKIAKTDSDIVAKIDAGLISKPTDICAVDADQNKKVDTFDALAISEIVAGTKTSPGNCGSPVITSGSSAKFIKGNAYTIAFKITNAALDSKLIYRLNDPNGSSAENATFDKTNTASSKFYLDQNNVLTFLMSFYPASSWTAGEYKAVFDVETNGVKLRANEIKLEILNPLPDLAIDDIYSDNGKLSVKIKNIGNAEASANKGHLYIYIDEQLKWTYSLSTLSDQKFRSIGGSSVIQPQILTGSHTIKATLDPKFEIAESNEDNNTLTKTVNFGETSSKPDLIFGDINISTGLDVNTKWRKLTDVISLNVNERVVGILANVKNNGQKNADYIQTEIKIVDAENNTVYTNIEIGQRDEILKVGEEKVIGGGWSWTPTKIGKYTFAFNIDSSNLIDESNENNNVFYGSVMVSANAITPKQLTISNLQVPTSLIRPTAAIVSWNTNFSTNSNVHYWSADKTQEDWKIDDYTQTNHLIKLNGLKPFTTYYFTVTSTKDGGDNKTSEQMSFTTTSLGTVIDNKIDTINNLAQHLNDNKFDQILEEIKTLKDVIKEQQAQIKYLTKLTQGVKELSEKATDAINNFITYGVDENTKRLGAGERAAVMYSYKAAFDKLPESETEFADAIKIANGRWPSITNQNAENRAKEQFQKVYKRTPGMNNARDNAAVTIMSYGLRQRAENRNMNSERAGIAIFKSIYNKLPQTTEEWNIMQAITYSGAAR
ncbi:MAG: CARDB domain-containing protein [bacterium]